jgi:DNA polymerase-3 subunit gamma/tau
MAYQSLYRRYRPQRFGDLIGQEHVVAALRNALREGRVGHAYLLSGPRGTGKTTTARLLAKALNCLAPADDAEPCGTCENCVAVAAGTFADLIELDAASNTGVDAVRDLIERVHLGLGATARRKVYLIDEVHMLSTAAGNALLKTLEEPPDHVVFVLATTNPERVLPTIRSRTQHFELALLPTDTLATHLARVIAAEGLDAEPGALDAVARAAAGSVRDALSILEQVVSHGSGAVTEAGVREALGHAPMTARLDIAHAIAAEDPAGALAAVGRLLEAGHDPRRVAEDLLRSLRDAFVLTVGRGAVPVDAADDERAALVEVGDALGERALVRSIETLGEAIVDMRGTDAVDPALALEVAVVRLARRDVGPALAALAERVERLERAVAGGTLAAGPSPAPAPAQPEAPGRPRSVAEPPDQALIPPPAAAAPDPLPAAEAPAGRPAPVTGAAPPDTADVPAPPPAAVAGDPAAGAGGRSAPEGAAGRDAAPVAFDLDEVILAWEQVLAGLAKGLRVSVQEAQPVAVEGNVIVFGVSPRQIDLVKPRFQREAHLIREQFIAALGAPPRFKFTTREFTAPVPPPVPPGPPVPHPPTAETAEVAEEVDLDAFTERAPDGPASTVGRLQETFGATIVEELPRT